MSNPLLAGKAAVVAGGSRGIGRAVARTLAAEEASVVVNRRSPAPAFEVAEEIRAAGGYVGIHAAAGESPLAWRDPAEGPWPVAELAERIRAGLARS